MNWKYKDKLFRFLFRDKKDLLELYNALNGTDYDNPDDLEVVTLEDVIFMKMKNDLSFIIARRLNLYEHQSTINQNLPLRGLIYFAQQYEGIVSAGKKSIYGEKRISLPTPLYVVFYNGMAFMEDETELYLSDSFEEGRGSGCLECRCRMLNINRGHNSDLIRKCRRLWEYSEFVSEVNEWIGRGKAREEAIQLAMDFCIENNILKDILIRQRTEVLHMLLTEFDEKKYKRTIYQDGYEEGELAGYSKGTQDGYSKGTQDGYSKGTQDGYSKGTQDGYSKGTQDGYSKGTQDGADEKIKSLVYKKLQKGKSVEVIAEELEMEVEGVQEMIDKIK